MVKTWIASVKSEHSINRVSLALGMKSKNGKEYGPCFCGATQRGTTDKRLPIGVTRGAKGENWRCYRCGAHGDVIDLVSFSIHGVRNSEVNDRRQIREFFDVTNFATDDVEIPNKVEFPPKQDIEKLSKVLGKTIIANFKHKEIYEYLQSRFIDPLKVTEASIYPDDFPYAELTRVPAKNGGKMEFWPSIWANKHPIAIPLYDPMGRIVSFQGRAILPNTKVKSRCPAHYSNMGLFFANSHMLNHLNREVEYKEFWIVEGEMDFLTLSSEYDVPVIGIRNGSIESFAYMTFPDNARIIIATDNNKVGEKYAERIATYLLKYNVERWVCDADVNQHIVDQAGDWSQFRSFIKTGGVFFGKIKAKEGVRKIKNCVRDIKRSTKEVQEELVFELLSSVTEMAYAKIFLPDELEQWLYKFKAIRGFKRET